MKYLETVKKVTGTVMLITGLVVAIGAALQAFTAKMQEHYPSPENKTDNGSN